MSLHFHTSLKRTSSLLERSLSLIRAVNTSYFQITDSLSLFLIAGIAVRPIYSNSFPFFSLLTLYKSTVHFSSRLSTVHSYSWLSTSLQSVGLSTVHSSSWISTVHSSSRFTKVNSYSRLSTVYSSSRLSTIHSSSKTTAPVGTRWMAWLLPSKQIVGRNFSFYLPASMNSRIFFFLELQ